GARAGEARHHAPWDPAVPAGAAAAVGAGGQMSEPVVIGEQPQPGGGGAPAVNPFAPPPTPPPAGTRSQTIVNGYIITMIANGYGGGTVDPQTPPQPVNAGA